MSVRIAINGFGRIGRNVFRAARNNPKIEIVAVNDLTDPATLAHLLKYDSVHGVFAGRVEATSDALIVDGQEVKVFAEKDPGALPWGRLGIEVAIESTGRFTARDQAARHQAAGAQKVIISAPGKGEDLTIVMGINESAYDPTVHHVISNASCTTNCLAPVAKVLLDNFGIIKGLMTTIHSYTNDQQILDLPHNDLRRARAAAVSMIPTTTGAAKAVSLVLPQLKGKLDGMAVRVPTPNVSLIDLVVNTEKETNAAEVNAALAAAAAGPLHGYMDYCTSPLVSVDFNGCRASSTVDSLMTSVIGGNMVKVMAWYDNESGYSNRIVDLILFLRTQRA